MDKTSSGITSTRKLICIAGSNPLVRNTKRDCPIRQMLSIFILKIPDEKMANCITPTYLCVWEQNHTN